MNSPSKRYEYRQATPADSAQILKLFECTDFKGNISVLFTRRPDPYASLMHEGEKAVILVASEKWSGIICAAGCCIIRKAYMNGRIVNTGYLAGLKTLPGFRKQLALMADAYRSLHELTKDDVDIYYTTILDDNTGAQRLLEKKHRNMPAYEYLGDYTVYCLKTGGRFGCTRNRQLLSNQAMNKQAMSDQVLYNQLMNKQTGEFSLEQGNAEGLESFYVKEAGGYCFTPAGSLYGVRKEDFYTLRDSSGSIIAAGAIWNQQSWKQYIITGYAGIYRFLKYLPVRSLGYPPLPALNKPADYASVAMLCVKDNDPAIAEYFIRALCRRAEKYDFIMCGFFEAHPLNAVFARLRHISYGSRLYNVHWEPEAPVFDRSRINLEVGLL